jgi:Ca-activated chloride channel family protein
MSFGSPWLLLCLLAVPLVLYGYVRLERRREREAEAWTTPALLPNMIAARPGWRRFVPLALFLVGLILLLVGFARPEAKISVPREGATVVLALDISGSMEAKDVQPTRLVAARQAAVQFVKDLPSKYRVALVTFSDHAAVKMPPTYDHDRVVRALPLKAREAGTALGAGIAAAVLVAQRAVGKAEPGESRPPAAVLLLSDGAQTAGRVDPADAAAEARKLDIPVSTISLGTPKGLLIRKIPGGTEQIQVPPVPAALREIAQITGGTFLQARTAKQLQRVYKDLGSRLVKERKRREITVAATGAAIVFMLAGAALSGYWFRRLV